MFNWLKYGTNLIGTGCHVSELYDQQPGWVLLIIIYDLNTNSGPICPSIVEARGHIMCAIRLRVKTSHRYLIKYVHLITFEINQSSDEQNQWIVASSYNNIPCSLVAQQICKKTGKTKTHCLHIPINYCRFLRIHQLINALIDW